MPDTRSQKIESKIYKGNFEKLIVWRKSHSLVLDIYKITKNFPKEEQLAITNQLKRAGYSVPANIAEGCSKSPKFFLSHLVIAQGSSEELKYFFILSRDLGYIDEKRFIELSAKANEVCKMVYALINNVRRGS